MKRLAFFVCAVSFAACSSTTTTSTTPSSAPSSDAGEDAVAPDDAGSTVDAAPEASDECQPPDNTAPAIDVTSVAEDPPAMTGGTIADGTYYLTSFVVYTGPDGGTVPAGSSLKATLVIAAGRAQFVDNASGPSAWTLLASGTNLTIRHTCPKKYDRQVQYTATPTTFAYAFEENGYPLVETFTKQ